MNAPNWLDTFHPKPSSLKTSALLLGISEEERPPHDVGLRRLLACHAGLREHTLVAEEYLREGNFKRAALCWQDAPSHQTKEIAARVMRYWSEFLQQKHQQIERCRGDAETLKQAGAAKITEVDDALSSAEHELAKLTFEQNGRELAFLMALDHKTLENLQFNIELAGYAIEEAQNELEAQRKREKQELIELKRKSDALIDELIFHPDERAHELGQKIQKHLQAHIRRFDVSVCRSLFALLSRLHQGESASDVQRGLDELVPPATSVAETQQAVPAPAMTLPTPVPSVGNYLSAWTRLQLAMDPKASGPASGVVDVKTLSATLRSWQQGELETLSTTARRLVRENSSNMQAVGVFLLASAKLSFLSNAMEEAHVGFRDLFRFCIVHGNAFPDVALWRDSAAWGFLLSILIPHLPKDERRRVRLPDNAQMLFYRPIGEMPLLRFDQLLLFSELAHYTLELGTPYASAFVNTYLSGYLRDYPVAAQEFIEGVVLELPGYWSVGLDILAHVLGVDRAAGIPEPLAATLRSMMEERAIQWDLSTKEGRDLLADRLARLHRKLSAAADGSDLISAAELSLAKVEKGLGDRLGPTVLATRLLTNEVDTSRIGTLTVELHYDKGAAVLRNLRTDVGLIGGSGKAIPDVLEPASVVPLLRRGEFRELSIALKSKLPAEVLEGARLKVVYGTLGTDKVFRNIESNANYLSLSPRELRGPEGRLENPYVVGTAVHAKELIYGRDAKVDEVVRSLIGAHQDNVVLLLGERKMGKTTVLNVVARHPDIAARYIVVRADIQDVSPSETAHVFFKTRMMDPILGVLRSKGVSLPALSEAGLRQNAYAAFKVFMEDLDRILEHKNLRLLLILDEMEKLIGMIESRSGQEKAALLGREAMACLRSVMQQSRRIAFLMAGVTDVLQKYTSQPENRLFRLALEVKLDPLPEPEARKLIREPADRAKVYGLVTQALDLIVAETSCQPYLLQFVGRTLWDFMMERGERVATKTLVEEVISDRVIPREEAFQHLTDAVPEPVDRRVVYALGALQFGDRNVHVKDIQRRLVRTGSQLTEDEIANRLLVLRSRAPMLVSDRHRFTRQFRLSAGLYARRLRYEQGQEQGLLVWR